jgi:lipopolysaccharide transport system ATP-binding protein
MSSDDVAIRVAGLSKSYHVYERPQDRLKQSLYLGRRQFYREFWALKEMSFEIRKGETVGIIGRNGSGKSTLLQLIAGTLTPTSGSVSVNGRVAALLELGSGFSPDFTGRENVYTNGAILGLSHEEIAARFDDIVAFADIGDFIDQPVKVYSSGMYMRLAFAIAVSVDPGILIVDEALSVGDEMFQRKCFARIQAIQQSGAAVLFVSHSAQSVVELCNTALLLDQGELIMSGKPKSVVTQYHKLLYASEHNRAGLRDTLRAQGSVAPESRGDVSDNAQTKPAPDNAYYDPALVPQSTVPYESLGARIENTCTHRLDGSPANVLVNGQTYRYSFSVSFTEPAFNVRFGTLIKTTSGLELGGSSSAARGMGEPYIAPGAVVHVSFQFRCLLMPGVYFMNAGCSGLINAEERYLHRLIDATMFRVLPMEDNAKTGIVDFELEPTIDITHG